MSVPCIAITHLKGSCEKTLMLGKIEGGRRRGRQRLGGITDLMDMRLSKLQEMGKDWET